MFSYPINRPQLADFCRRHHIRRLALFGSVLRDDFGPDSDIDVLVEFEPGCVPGLAFIGMQTELTNVLGRRVDLNTPQSLSKYFRDEVLAEAEVLYEQEGQVDLSSADARLRAGDGRVHAGQNPSRPGS